MADDALLPGAAPPTSGTIQYDPAKDLYYFDRGDHKQYVSPLAFSANGPSGKGTGFGKNTPQSSGLLHGRGEWNAETGQFDQGLNWGNIGALAVGGVMGGAGLAAAAGGGAGAGAAGAGSGAFASGSTVPTLGALAGGTASGAVPAALAGGSALAAGSTVPVVGGLAGGVSSGAVPAALATSGGGAGLGSTAGHFMTSALGQQAISTGGNLFGSLFATHANSEAADKQSEAAKYAADLQAKAANDALAFQKQQAALDAQNAEITRKGNYDQWVARQSDLNTFGNLLGLPNRNVPEYKGLQLYGDGSGQASASQTGQANSSTGDLQAYFNGLFPGDTLDNDMLVAKEAELGTKGIKVLRNAEGRAGKIQLPNGQIVDVVQGGGTGVNRKQWLTGGGPTASAPTVAKTMSPNSLASLTAPWASSPLTPALEAPNPWSLYGMAAMRKG